MFKDLLNKWRESTKAREDAEKRKRSSCVFCGQLENEIKAITDHVPVDTGYGYYYPSYKYHRTCLLDVINNPEKWNHKTVDTALKITELIDYWRRHLDEARKILATEKQ